MKVGDKKQAIILGVVAVGSVGFLGKSVLETFIGGGSPQSAAVPVREAKATSPAPSPVPQNGSKPAQEPVNSGVFPEVKEGESAPPVTQVAMKQDVPIELYNDGFAAPILKNGGVDSKETTSEKKENKEKEEPPKATKPEKPKQPKSMKGSIPLPVIGGGSGIGGSKFDAKPDENTGKDQQPKKEDSKSTLRFCGLVESKKKMAIIEFQGQSMTVSKGQMVDDDLYIVDVSFNSIKVQRGLKKYEIALGGKRDL